MRLAPSSHAKLHLDCACSSAPGQVNNQTNPATFYGKNASPKQRQQERERYFVEGPSADRLCARKDLYLDSFLQASRGGGARESVFVCRWV